MKKALTIIIFSILIASCAPPADQAAGATNGIYHPQWLWGTWKSTSPGSNSQWEFTSSTMVINYGLGPDYPPINYNIQGVETGFQEYTIDLFSVAGIDEDIEFTLVGDSLIVKTYNSAYPNGTSGAIFKK